MLASVSCGARPRCGTLPDHAGGEVTMAAPPGLGAGRGRAGGVGARATTRRATPRRARATRWSCWPAPGARRRRSRRWCGAARTRCGGCSGATRRRGRTGCPTGRRPGHRGRLPGGWGRSCAGSSSWTRTRWGWPARSGRPGCWPAYLAGATGHRAHLETVRRHLHQAGYVCKRPGWTLKRKAEEEPEWAGNG